MLGADSTASLTYPDGFHYFNHAQKLFRIGESGSLGILTWGLGGLHQKSYRTLIAELADDVASNPPADLLDVATRWAARFWAAYSGVLAMPIQRCRDLNAKPAAVPGTVDPAARTQEEETEFNNLRHGLVVGFCIAGAVPGSRVTGAYEIIFEPLLTDSPVPSAVQGAPFWGAPNMIQRLIIGADPSLREAILVSGHWAGTEAELDNLMVQQRLSHAILPIRDAIDFVYTCIYSTIKALKFSSLQQICGGPIEIAIITTDREFRWVRHKAFDAAISEGERP